MKTVEPCARARRRPRALAFAIALCVLFIMPAFEAGGQTSASDRSSAPMGFRGIDLMMSLDAVKEKLRADPLFSYRGEPDVSLLPEKDQTLIECEGNSYIRRSYFQFAQNHLFTMILVLNPQRLDYYSLFTALSKKYGDPASLDPRETVWLFDSLRLSLERPLTVKYIERKVFESLVTQGSAQTDLEQLSREKFIEQF